MKHFLIIVFTLFSMLFGSKGLAQVSTKYVEFANLNREVSVYTPPSLDSNHATIIALHGFSMHAALMRQFLDHYGEHNNTVILSLDGNGDRHDDELAGQEIFLIHALLDSFPKWYPKADLCASYLLGYSYGAREALYFGMSASDRIQGVLAFSPAIQGEEDADNFETLEKSRGRVESREYYSIDAEGIHSGAQWAGLTSLGMVIRERTNKGKRSKEIEYYICSTEINAPLLEKVVRGHWGIENTLHWVLDVTFREDKVRYRERTGAQNLAAIRKIIHGVLSKDTKLKCGKQGKRLVAATDPQYREELLKKLF